jgi:hypothetical protein
MCMIAGARFQVKSEAVTTLGMPKTRSEEGVSCRTVPFPSRSHTVALPRLTCLVVRVNKCDLRIQQPPSGSFSKPERQWRLVLRRGPCCVDDARVRLHSTDAEPSSALPSTTEELRTAAVQQQILHPAGFGPLPEGRRPEVRLLSTNNRLLLYSLYKQATRGDAPLTYESRRMHLTFS